MDIKLWKNFSKRRNSTKQPPDAGAVTKSVRLKEDTSLENPSFIINEVDFDYNYVQAMGHYYFVSDVVALTNSMSEIRCEQDVLATHKTAIGNYSAFVLYSNSGSIYITDSRLALDTKEVRAYNQVDFRDDYNENGSILVTLTGEDKVGTYGIDVNDISKLFPHFKDTWDSIIEPITPTTNLADVLSNALYQLTGSGDIQSNIKDVRWIPFSTGGGAGESIKAGLYTLDLQGRPRTRQNILYTAEVEIPWRADDFRRLAPYTQILLYIPYIGVINIDPSTVSQVDTLQVISSLDNITGDLSVMVQANYEIIGTYGASTAVSIPIGATRLDVGRIANSIIAGTSAAIGGNIAGVVGAGLSAINPVSTSVGGISNGSGSGLLQKVRCMTVFHDTNIAPSSVAATMGIPTFSVKRLGTLSGYIQCQNASIELTGMASDRDVVNSFLNGGFYYE